jgi:hypothetical protein
MVSGEELLPRLVELYQRIDRTYAAVSQEIALFCDGCDGVRCCTVDLTVHTSVEMLYLRRGLNALDHSLRDRVLEMARAIVKAKDADPFGPDYRDSVCALNREGKCLLYEFRPMICRLAGVPHWFIRLDGQRIESGGCSRLEALPRSPGTGKGIDRTPFYWDLAELEGEIARVRGTRTKPQTVSEILTGE